MHQVSKPRAANQSITDESARPGTRRSKVGCEAMDEPCTNRIVPLGAPPGAAFCQRQSLTSPLRVQCSMPGNVNGASRSFLAFYARIRRLRRGEGGGGSMASGTLDTFPKLLMHHAQVRGERPAIREKDLGIWQT